MIEEEVEAPPWSYILMFIEFMLMLMSSTPVNEFSQNKFF